MVSEQRVALSAPGQPDAKNPARKNHILKWENCLIFPYFMNEKLHNPHPDSQTAKIQRGKKDVLKSKTISSFPYFPIEKLLYPHLGSRTPKIQPGKNRFKMAKLWVFLLYSERKTAESAPGHLDGKNPTSKNKALKGQNYWLFLKFSS